MNVQYFSEFFYILHFFKVLPINTRGRRGLRKVGVVQNVPDECNLITVFCLSCWGVDCASPDKSKLEWKLHFLEWKSRSLGIKKVIYVISERPFQGFITIFFTLIWLKSELWAATTVPVKGIAALHTRIAHALHAHYTQCPRILYASTPKCV